MTTPSCTLPPPRPDPAARWAVRCPICDQRCSRRRGGYATHWRRAHSETSGPSPVVSGELVLAPAAPLPHDGRLGLALLKWNLAERFAHELRQRGDADGVWAYRTRVAWLRLRYEAMELEQEVTDGCEGASR